MKPERHIIFVSVIVYPITYIAVEAIKEHGMCYRILDECEDDEHYPWEFNYNEIVECKWHKFSEDDDPDLLAVKICENGDSEVLRKSKPVG